MAATLFRKTPLAIGGHSLGGVEGERCAEHRQTGQHGPRGPLEQINAPLNRLEQCLVAGGSRAGPVAQQRQRLAQPHAEPIEGHRANPGRVELNGQRKAVEPVAELDDGRRGVSSMVKLGRP